MNVFIRTNKLLVTNISDVLDKAENPAKMLRHMIVEMEEAIISAQSDIARLRSQQKAKNLEIDKQKALQLSWTDKAKLAMSKDRVDLARGALTESEKATDVADKLQTEIAETNSEIEMAEANVAKLQQKLGDARVRQKDLIALLEPTNAPASGLRAKASAKIEKAMDRIDVLEKRVDFAEARVQSTESSREARNLEKEIDDMALASRVDARLAALKPAKAKKGNRATP